MGLGQLDWPAGPRASDGVWAPYWYEAVWKSTGFEPWRDKRVPLPPGLAAVAERFPGFLAIVWYGLVAPKGLPGPVRRHPGHGRRPRRAGAGRAAAASHRTAHRAR